MKAEPRLDSVVDGVRKYADRMLQLPLEAVAVLVTYMDTVSWNR